jgi:hypothetical protein
VGNAYIIKGRMGTMISFEKYIRESNRITGVTLG